jgi:hypothetical protein
VAADNFEQTLYESARNEPPPYVQPPASLFVDDVEVPNKLVRLDVAVMALRLMALRVVCRRLPKVFQSRLMKLEVALGSSAGGFIIGKAIGHFAKPLMAVANAFEATRFEKEVSDGIEQVRKEIFEDLLTMFLGARKKPRERKTRRVWTRHQSQRQRKPNRSWTNPKPC